MSSLDHLSPELSATPTRRRVMDRFRQLRNDQRVCVDGYLPSERELAERVQVSRPTLRSILNRMETEGLIQSRAGVGRHFTEKADAIWAEDGPSLLERSIVLLEDQSLTQPRAGQEGSGWEYHTSMSVVWALHQRGLSVVMIPPAEYEAKRAEAVVDAAPRGILSPMLGHNPEGRHHLIDQARQRGLPVVVRVEDLQGMKVDAVGSDHEAGAYQLARYLIERGRRSLWMVWHRGSEERTRERAAWLDQRIAGARRAFAEASLDQPRLIEIDTEGLSGPSGRAFERGVRLSGGYLAELLAQQQPLDAVMVASDGQVPEIAGALRLVGKRPNEDVDIVGYDNYWAEVIERQSEPTPPLATVDKQNARIGEEMVNLLEQRIAGDLPDEPQLRLVEPTVVIPAEAGEQRTPAVQSA